MRISDWSSDVCSSDLDHGAVLRWASNPTVALALILLVASVFWHLRLGLQVMTEDYVHGQAARLFALVLLNFYAIGGGAYGISPSPVSPFPGVPRHDRRLQDHRPRLRRRRRRRRRLRPPRHPGTRRGGAENRLHHHRGPPPT